MHRLAKTDPIDAATRIEVLPRRPFGERFVCPLAELEGRIRPLRSMPSP